MGTRLHYLKKKDKLSAETQTTCVRRQLNWSTPAATSIIVSSTAVSFDHVLSKRDKSFQYYDNIITGQEAVSHAVAVLDLLEGHTTKMIKLIRH